MIFGFYLMIKSYLLLRAFVAVPFLEEGLSAPGAGELASGTDTRIAPEEGSIISED